MQVRQFSLRTMLLALCGAALVLVVARQGQGMGYGMAMAVGAAAAAFCVFALTYLVAAVFASAVGDSPPPR